MNSYSSTISKFQPTVRELARRATVQTTFSYTEVLKHVNMRKPQDPLSSIKAGLHFYTWVDLNYVLETTESNVRPKQGQIPTGTSKILRPAGCTHTEKVRLPKGTGILGDQGPKKGL
jgi:hypothetical protein